MPSHAAGTIATARRAYRDDSIAVVTLLIVSFVFTWRSVSDILAFMRGDWPTFFFPAYAFLGARLRALDIPGWNPHQFSGTPFAADPESGWGYLPAMFFYSLFSAESATVLFIGFHIAFAAVAMYTLARLLGLFPLGAFVAGAAYSLAWVATASTHLVIWSPVASWTLVALAGAELAIRAASWSGRVWAWLLAGLAASQILAIWLGQGALYAAMVIAAWICYRTLLAPAVPTGWRARFASLLINGAGMGVVAGGLSAAALLPRVDAITRSNLAGAAYEQASAWADAQVGFSLAELLYETVGGYTGSLWWYVGAAAAALALLAPLVTWRWSPWPYFAGVALVSGALALEQRTPVHLLLYTLLPPFEHLHEHAPERVLILLPPSVAMLAGATVAYLPRRHPKAAPLAIVAALPAFGAVALTQFGGPFAVVLSPESATVVIATCALIAATLLMPEQTARRAALAGLVLLVLWDPMGRLLWCGFADESRLEPSLRSVFAEEADAFLHANEPAAFLAQRAAEKPARYAGFNPAILPDPATFATESPDIGYRGWHGEAGHDVSRLLVFNWATWFGLDDAQGYNPVQVQRYVEFVDAMNGHVQEYHERDLYPGALDSPFLDLLNLRYLVVPAEPPKRAEDVPWPSTFNTVYEDPQVTILENPDALPRSWLVHRAEHLGWERGLARLQSGLVDPRQTAILESPAPPLGLPGNPATELATVTRHEPDRVEVRVTAQAPALLILSEVWDPGWSATVDGVAAPVLVAYHAFRAVPVPAGEHVIIMRYDPPLLRLGLAITAATAGLGVAAALGLWSRAMRRRHAGEVA